MPLSFLPHTSDTAPEAAQPILKANAAFLGFVPSLMARLAETPTLLQGFMSLTQLFASGTFDPCEQEVVLTTAAFENQCRYCMAFHTLQMRAKNLDEGLIDALRTGSPLPDPRLEALADLTRQLIRGRGQVSPETQERFLAAGFTSGQALEVIVGIASQVLSNYGNHLVQAPLDASLETHAWEPQH